MHVIVFLFLIVSYPNLKYNSVFGLQCYVCDHHGFSFDMTCKYDWDVVDCEHGACMKFSHPNHDLMCKIHLKTVVKYRSKCIYR